MIKTTTKKLHEHHGRFFVFKVFEILRFHPLNPLERFINVRCSAYSFLSLELVDHYS